MDVGKERRDFPRCEVKRSINYRVAGDKYIHIAYIKNLGSGGLCFQSSEEIKEGVGIDIEFELPESLDRIVATGVVIW
ncbi:MAG: PilZ domain-containing protein, partial [bacterium]